MKRFIAILAAITITTSLWAQSPQKMSYQAVIRNSSDALVTNTQIGMQISILQGSPTGTEVYSETLTPTTNANGLVSVEIGSGAGFATIDWSNGPYFIKTETDPDGPIGGISYTITGISQLLSVPYALHAKTAESFSGTITESDPVFGTSVASGINTTDITNWNNKLNSEVDGSITNEIQVLSINHDTIFLSNGGFVKLPADFSGDYNDLTNKPTIPVVPANVSDFTNDAGYLTSFTEVDGSVTNELQILSISNDTIRLTNGGFVKLPAGFSGNYNDLTNKPTIPVVPTNVGSFTNDVGYLTSYTEIDGSVTNEIQFLSLSHDTIFLNNGGFVKLPAGFDGQYSSLTGMPTNVSSFTNDAGYLTNFTEVDPKIGSNTTGYFPKWNGSMLVSGAIYQNATGNVGIGTNNPVAVLDINGIDGLVRFKNTYDDIGGFLANTYDAVQLGMFNPTGGNVNQLPAESGRSFFGFDATGKVGSLTNYFLSNTYRNLLDDGNGNAGIGTTAPAYKLDVNGDVNVSGNYRINGVTLATVSKTGSYIDLINKPTNVSSFTNDAGYLTSFTETDPEVGTNTTNYVSKWNGTALVSSVVYDDGTNVGIGTTSPAYKLDVAADVQINGVRVGLGAGNQVSNVVVGSSALMNNTTGFANTALGLYTLFSNTTGSTNTAVGQHSLYANTIGTWNTALGCQALRNNIDGNSNTALGLQSLHANTSGNNNTAVGRDALLRYTTGNNNVALGQEAGFNGISGSGNVFLGYQAGYSEAGSNKLYIANTSTSTPLLYGDFSTATLTVYSNLNINNAYAFPNADGTSGQVLSTNGAGVLGWNNLAAVATSGSYSDLSGVPTNVSAFTNDAGYLTAFTETDPEVGVNSTNYVSKWNGSALVSSTVYDDGTNVGIGTSTPAYKLDVIADAQINGVRIGRGNGNVSTNTATGADALKSNTSGQYNSANGYHSLYFNTVGERNTANGFNALYYNSTGNSNTAIGQSSLQENTNGSENTATGRQSLQYNIGGSENAAYGFWALNSNITGIKNTGIGNYAGALNITGSSNVFIGYRAGQDETGSNKLYISNSSTSTPLIYGDFSTSTLTVYSNLNINNAYAFPNADGTSGQVLSTNGAGVLGWNSLATVATSGSYNDLIDKPIIPVVPTNLSAFINDAGYLTDESQVLSINHDTIFLTGGSYVKLPDSHPGSTLPTVVTVSVSDVAYTGCRADGNVTVSGGELVVSRGIVLASHNNPTLSDTVITSGSGAGTYDVQISQLEPNHTYYIRAYATNILGTVYGAQLSFTTLALTTPTLTTNAVYNISHTTAMSGGNITDDGGSALFERGVCWSLNSSPTIADHTDPQGTAVGNFNALMSGLTPNTLYYVRAYAINAQGTAYGNELSFTTNTLSLASITTTAPSAVSYTTATSGGNVTSDNGSSVTSRGICWATTSSPTTANSVYSEAGGLGSFTAGMTGLLPATTYYVRAFAINGAGTVYGNEYNFTTSALTAPVLTTKSISGISSDIAGSGGNISSDGGSAITAKGVCWSLNTAPTLVGNHTSDGTGAASFNSTITGLNPLTLYYVRAYATNATGTIYGNELSFTTTDLVFPGPSVPTVGTSTSSITGSSTASSGGYVSSDGGSAVTVRGVCWSTNPNPTLADNFSTDGGTGVGYFSSMITGLSGCGNVYYVRAYATNSTGTGYGNQNTVTTGLLPAVTTDDVSGIDYYAAISGGTVTDDGGCPITARGVCWNYTENPTISNSHTSDGSGTGTFVSNVTGLYANQTYYVRAYVTSSKGTTYGPQKVFTTAVPSTRYIGENYAGGIVFYLDGTGEHGLVCAQVNHYATWGCDGTFIGSTSSALGSGAANTATILAVCNSSESAAYLCDTLTLSGYYDWFLPSTDELMLMHTNLYTRGLGNFESTIYWSSTENSSSIATSVYFPYGWTDNRPKSWNINVRAVRAF